MILVRLLGCLLETGDAEAYRGGGDVRQVGSNSGGVDDIVESKLVNERTGLEEQRQRLYKVSASVLKAS